MIKLEVVSELFGKFYVKIPCNASDEETKERIIGRFRENVLQLGDRYRVLDEEDEE